MIPFEQALQIEREYQQVRWTDPHDDTHPMAEWSVLIAEYARRFVSAAAVVGADWPRDLSRQDRLLVRNAAVALAALCWAMDDSMTRSDVKKEATNDPE